MRLLAVQRNFQSWLMSESTEVAARFGEHSRAGLSVYLNNYRGQLLSCLSASFPVLRAWLGDTDFEAAAAKYIDEVPPHAWTLDAYGLAFPDKLARLYPADAEIAELARLERELAVAFVGQDAAPIDAATLANIDWDAAIVEFLPTLKSLPVTTNVAAIWSAINDQETPPSAALLTEPACLVVWRYGLAPRFRTVSADEATVLSQLREGKTFGAICATLVARLGEERGPAMAGSFLGQWLSDGLIARIR